MGESLAWDSQAACYRALDRGVSIPSIAEPDLLEAVCVTP